MTWPKKIRPETGLSSIWVWENSACKMDTSSVWPAAMSSSVKGCGKILSHLRSRASM